MLPPTHMPSAFAAYRALCKQASPTDFLGQAIDYVGKNPWAQGALAGGGLGAISGLFSSAPGSVLRNAALGAGIGAGAGGLYQSASKVEPPIGADEVARYKKMLKLKRMAGIGGVNDPEYAGRVAPLDPITNEQRKQLTEMTSKAESKFLDKTPYESVPDQGLLGRVGGRIPSWVTRGGDITGDFWEYPFKKIDKAYDWAAGLAPFRSTFGAAGGWRANYKHKQKEFQRLLDELNQQP